MAEKHYLVVTNGKVKKVVLGAKNREMLLDLASVMAKRRPEWGYEVIGGLNYEDLYLRGYVNKP